MKEYRFIITRVFTVFFLLVASLNLSGCSYISDALSGTYNAIMWAPRKAWEHTGGKVFDVKNEQQTDLGPRRKPAGNPSGIGGIGIAPLMPVSQGAPGNAYQPMGAMDQGMPAMPPSMPQNMQSDIPGMGGLPPMGQNIGSAGSYPLPQDTMPMPNMPLMPEPGTMQGTGNMPPANFAPQMPMAQQGGMGQAPGAYPSVNPYATNAGSANGMPPMPPMPQNGMPPAYGSQQPMGMNQMGAMGSMSQDSMEADAAYNSGGGGGQKSKWWSWIPFTSSEYKIERKFEPLSAEFTIAAKDFPPHQYPDVVMDPFDVEPLPPKNHNKNRAENPVDIHPGAKANRAASMFPLDQYAPKPTVVVQKIDDKPNAYPKLGDVPVAPKTAADVNAANSELEKIIKESEAINAKQSVIHKDDNVPPADQNPQGGKYKLLGPEDKTLKPRSSRYGTVGEPMLQNDMAVIKSVPQDVASNAPSITEKKKGFFASLFGFDDAPEQKKIITRKSQPPTAQEIQAYKSRRPSDPNEIVRADDNAKNYQPDSESLLPKSRYADRRKVPQTDE